MGYFEGFTDAHFKTDKEGNEVFYPWGILGGKGYILPENGKSNFGNIIKKYWQISLSVSIATTMFLKWWLVIFFVLPLYLCAGAIWTKILTKDFIASTEKLTLDESTTNSARSLNLATLWLFEICSLLFVIAGVFIIVVSPKDRLMGTLSILFFGLCGYIIGKMIKNKKPIHTASSFDDSSFER